MELLVAIIIPQLAGIIGSLFTFTSINTWYATLNKPFFTPPGFLFGPVWITLYLLMGIASYLVWKKGIKKKKVRIALSFYLIQLSLNTLWSVLFFGLHSPLYGFIEILFLWVFIAITIISFYKISKPAAYLLIPYILWVSLASLLNFSILQLNI